MNKGKTYVDLPLEKSRRKMFINLEDLKLIREELEVLIENNKRSQTVNFTKNVLFPYEVKINDQIEGYSEGIDSVDDIIKNPNLKANRSKEEYQRVMNITRAYRLILNRKKINEESLSKLYATLSNNILPDTEKLEKDCLYRQNDVYIHYSKYINIEPDQGISPGHVKKHMDLLFDFINSHEGADEVENFIISQILHLYFVYIHPYYDVNGRTARTLSLWYLIKNEAYPFTIFNRGIQYTKKDYYKIIREAIKYGNLTYFVKYLMTTVKTEIIKDNIVNEIIKDTDTLTHIEVQALHYMLTMNGTNTLLDFTTFYNTFNNKKTPKEIESQIISPLLDKKIILPGRETKKHISSINKQNYVIDVASNKAKVYKKRP